MIQLVYLAEVREIETPSQVVLFPRGSVLAVPDTMRGCLYGFESVRTSDPSGSPSWEAMEGFWTFSGKEPTHTVGIEVPVDWSFSGIAESVLYRSDKLHGGGNGRKNLFRHKFNPGTRLYRSRSCPEWVKIEGTDLVVEDRGIVN